MSREFTLIRLRRFTGRRTRQLTKDALLVYQLLHYQPDLTSIGTLMLNVDRLALAATDLDKELVLKALVELGAHGLILTDSCTQELLLGEFWDETAHHNRNHIRGAARAFRSVESERLRAAVYETSPQPLREAIDEALQSDRGAIPMPSEAHPDPTPVDVDVNVNVDVDVDLAVVKAFWQLNGETGMDEDARSIQSRVEAATVLLAERRVAEQPLNRTLAASLSDQWGRHGELLRSLAGGYPDWSAIDLARAIDGGAFSAFSG